MQRLSVAAVALLAVTAPAWAQFDPTTEPSQPAQPAPAQRPAIQQAPLGSDQPSDGPDAPAQASYQQGLDTLDPSSSGILNPSNGGFPASMWMGTDRRAIVALLPRMPIGKGSPSMRSLAERLLLSEAQVPPRGSKDAYDVFRARVDRLVAAGYAAEVADLFGRVPEKLPDTRLAHARVDALMLTGDLATACDEALSANQRSEEASWLATAAYCKLTSGDADGAAFAADMLRETGADDPDFFALLAWLSQPEEARKEKPKLANTQPLTALRFIMLKASGNDIAPQTLDQAAPVVLVAVANDKDLAPDLRLAAAERAARAGAIGARDLAAAYAGVTLDAPALADPVTAAQAQPGGRGNALLYQAAMQAADPVSRLTILRAIWARAKADGSYLLAVRVNVEATKALMPAPAAAPVAEPPPPPPEAALAPENAPAALVPDSAVAESPTPDAAPLAPELIAAAPEITRALLAAGEAAAARAWYGVVADQASSGDPNATVVQAQLWPLMLAADPDTRFDEGVFDAWWQHQSGLGGGDRSRRGTVLMAVMEGLSMPVRQDFWRSLYDGADAADGRMPALPVWRGLNAASEANRLGETVMLSLVMLGDAGPGKANPAVLADLLKGLVKVGLEPDARALALEALIDSGF